MAKPKLALIPAAQGTKLYSVLPSDGTGDFTFTRGSVATRINAQGLIENVASGQSRLDYPLIDGVQKGCPHHILEPARTNTFAYSEDFSNASWTKQDSSITSNQAVSPDGTLNADLYTSISDIYDFVRKSLTFTTGITYTLSVFVKSGTSNEVRLDFPSAFTDRSVSFNIENKTYTKVNGSPISKIEDYGNGWVRCSITSTATSTSFGFTGFSSIKPIAVSTLYLWGAMLEQGSFISSYIPTTTTAVTRSAETATGAGNSSTFNDSEGVLMAEIAALADDADTLRWINLSNGLTSNRVAFYYRTDINQLTYLASSNGATQVFSTVTLSSASSFNKIAAKYKQNDFSLWINGYELITDTSANAPIGLNEISFDNAVGGDNFYGKTKQLQYFDSALADTQLEQLTSWQSFRDMAEGQLYTIE